MILDLPKDLSLELLLSCRELRIEMDTQSQNLIHLSRNARPTNNKQNIWQKKLPIIFRAMLIADIVVTFIFFSYHGLFGSLFSVILKLIAFLFLSVGAALYTESLFKSNTVKGETFLDQQFWMYFYESLVGMLLHYITNSSYTVMSLTSDLLGMY